MQRYRELIMKEDFLRVLVIGDFATRQEMADINWISWLRIGFQEDGDPQKTWRRLIFTTAIQKATASAYLNSYDQLVRGVTPDVVVMSFNTLAFTSAFDIEDYKRDIKKLVERIYQDKIEVLLWSPYSTFNTSAQDEYTLIEDYLKNIALGYDVKR